MLSNKIPDVALYVCTMLAFTNVKSSVPSAFKTGGEKMFPDTSQNI
jgi:hypothetical protein